MLPRAEGPVEVHAATAGAVSRRPPGPRIDVTVGGATDSTYPRVEIAFADGALMTPGIHFSTPRSSRPLALDLYRPAHDAPKPGAGFPMLMFIHGGSWARGHSRASRPLKAFPWVLAAIAARGYVVASIEYRLVGEALWPAQGQDVKAAIRFLRKHAAAYGIDPNRFAAWGVSCGGHLAAIAAATRTVASLAPLDEELSDVDDSIQAAVSWYGGFNMETIIQQSEQVGALSRTTRDMPEWNLLGGMPADLDPDYVRSAGPVNFVTADTAQMLILAGDSDRLIPYLQSVEMADRMVAVGAQAELVLLPGVGHDFAGESYEQTLAANQRAMDLTIAFLDRVFQRDGTTA